MRSTIQQLKRSLSALGFEPADAVGLEFVKSYTETPAHLVRTRVFFAITPNGPTPTSITVSEQSVFMPDPAALERAPLETRGDLHKVLEAFPVQSIQAQSIMTRRCSVCPRVVASFFVVDEFAFCESCLDAKLAAKASS